MKVISHRGNLVGPDKTRENAVISIIECLKLHLDVEIDVHMQDGYFYLDHDGPINNKISLTDFYTLFNNYQKQLWVHCKNLEAFVAFNQSKQYSFNYFGHTDDSFVLTSHGYIFTRPGVKAEKNVVCVMPELAGLNIDSVKKYDFVLTDYPLRYI